MSDALFEATYRVTWGDLDSNVHMRNTAYLDYAAQTRFLYLESHGFTPADFRAAAIGPVVFKDEVTYLKELRHLEEFRVDVRLGAQNPDGSRFMLVNRYFRQDGTLCAEVRSTGCWFDVRQRKVTAPPEKLFAAMNKLPKTEDFRALESSG